MLSCFSCLHLYAISFKKGLITSPPPQVHWVCIFFFFSSWSCSMKIFIFHFPVTLSFKLNIQSTGKGNSQYIEVINHEPMMRRKRFHRPQGALFSVLIVSFPKHKVNWHDSLWLHSTHHHAQVPQQNYHAFTMDEELLLHSEVEERRVMQAASQPCGTHLQDDRGQTCGLGVFFYLFFKFFFISLSITKRVK